jgi:hypothetical protein
MKFKFQHLIAGLMVAGLIACKDKKTTQAETEVTPGPLANITEYERSARQTNVIDPNDSGAPNTDPKGEKPLPRSKERTGAAEGTNPLHENPVLTNTFQTYIDSGIDDSNMDGLLDKLKEEDLSAEDFTAVMNQYFSILTNRDEELIKTFTIENRMKSIFDLYGSNKLISNEMNKKLTPDQISGFSPEELKIVSPMVYASQVYGQLKQVSAPSPLAYSSKDSRDGKTYRTVIFGRIDFSKGIKKKSLDKKDLEQIVALQTIWTGLLSSSSVPTNIDKRIIGFADRDKPANESKNVTHGNTRAQMVYDAFATTDLLKGFKVDSMGDHYPMLDDAKNASNRRVEFFLMHREIQVNPMGKLPPAHEHEEGEEDHAS